jgi:RND family efflux transporter MFP subunit
VSDLSADLHALRIDRSGNSRGKAIGPGPSGGGGGGGGSSFPWRGLLVAGGLVGGGLGAWLLLGPTVEAALFRTEITITEIVRVSPAQASVDLTSSGYVVAERVAKVGPLVPGRITKMAVHEGQVVKEGDVLFELDVGDQRAAAATLSARATAATARALASEAQAAELRQRLLRDRALADQGTVSRAPVDDLAAQLKSAEEAAKASASEARAAAADARASSTQLRHGVLRAPIGGTIVGKPPQVGDVLNPASFQAAFDIVDLDALVIEVDVPEARLSLTKPQAPTEIVLDSAPEVRLRGMVKRVTPRVNRSKATVVVQVAFVDKPALVFPEMAARVSFLAKALDEETRKAPPKTIVPGVAVAERAGAKVVFVVDGTNVKMVPVTLGPAFGDGFELVSGPPPGTKIVKTPAPSLVDGKGIKERSAG